MDVNAEIDAIHFERIRNRNEKRVLQAMKDQLAKWSDYRPETLDLQDIYALALNTLPAHYVQTGTIVLNEKVDMSTIVEVVKQAIEQVRKRPKHD